MSKINIGGHQISTDDLIIDVSDKFSTNDSAFIVLALYYPKKKAVRLTVRGYSSTGVPNVALRIYLPNEYKIGYEGTPYLIACNCSVLTTNSTYISGIGKVWSANEISVNYSQVLTASYIYFDTWYFVS